MLPLDSETRYLRLAADYGMYSGQNSAVGLQGHSEQGTQFESDSPAAAKRRVEKPGCGEPIHFGIRTASAGSEQDFPVRLNRHRSVRSKGIGRDKYAIHREGLVQAAIGEEAQHGWHRKIVVARNSSNDHDLAIALHRDSANRIKVRGSYDRSLLSSNAAIAKRVIEFTCLSGCRGRYSNQDRAAVQPRILL